MIFASVPSAFLIAGAVAANSCATIFLRGFSRAEEDLSTRFPFLSLPQWSFGCAALFFYMVAFSLYALVLQRWPIGIAYLVITSLTQLLLLSYGLWFLHEHLPLTAWAGVGLTMIGLALIFLQTGAR